MKFDVHQSMIKLIPQPGLILVPFINYLETFVRFELITFNHFNNLVTRWKLGISKDQHYILNKYLGVL